MHQESNCDRAHMLAMTKAQAWRGVAAVSSDSKASQPALLVRVTGAQGLSEQQAPNLHISDHDGHGPVRPVVHL